MCKDMADMANIKSSKNEVPVCHNPIMNFVPRDLPAGCRQAGGY